MFINNEKGNEWLENVKKDLDYIKCDVKKCIECTYTLNQPTPMSEDREEFWKDYSNNDFEFIINKYAK